MRHSQSMRSALIALAICFAATASIAQVPRTMNYQGKLTDANGSTVSDGIYSMKFAIFATSTGGDPLWSTYGGGYTPVQVDGGLFNHALGSTNPLPDSLARYDSLWLSITVAPDDEVHPRTPLTSMGFAFKALSAVQALTSVNSAHADSAEACARASVADSADSYTDASIDFSDIAQNGAALGQVMKWSGETWTAADDNTASLRRIAMSAEVACTSGATFVPLAVFDIGAGQVDHFVYIVSQVRGGSFYTSDHQGMSSLRIVADDVIQLVFQPSQPPGGIPSGEVAACAVNTYVHLFYEPTEAQKLNGFTIKVEGRWEGFYYGDGAMTCHNSTDIWGM